MKVTSTVDNIRENRLRQLGHILWREETGAEGEENICKSQLEIENYRVTYPKQLVDKMDERRR